MLIFDRFFRAFQTLSRENRQQKWKEEGDVIDQCLLLPCCDLQQHVSFVNEKLSKERVESPSFDLVRAWSITDK